MSGIVVFGRHPVPGRVKTRLAAGIGDRAAAAVYTILLEHTLFEAVATGEEVVLSLADEGSAMWSPPYQLRTEVQGGGSLGDRLADAFDRRFREGWERVLVIGSDCLGVSSERLSRALASLREVPVVLGPASDGGYWAVGQRVPGHPIFGGIAFSSAHTLGHTRRRIEELEVRWLELEPLSDVDTLSNLDRVLKEGQLPVELASRLRRAAGPRPEAVK